MNKKNILFILVITLFFYSNADAGWVVTQRNYDSDEGVESAITEIVFMQNNKMKIIQDQIITTFNLKEESITLMNTLNKVYWKGKVDDYKREIKAAMQIAMDEQLKKATVEQQEMIQKMYAGMMESIDNPSKFAGEEPDEYNIEIVKTEEKEEIAGRIAVKYDVMINGMINEEVWISESVSTNTEFDLEQFHTIFKDFISQSDGQEDFQLNEKYLEFSKKGFPLKSINYNDGYETISEVFELINKTIDESEFNVPADFKEVNITEIGISHE